MQASELPEGVKHALKLLKAETAKHPGRRYLDAIYGPYAVDLRRLIVAHICRRTTLASLVLPPKSDKGCQYGNLRTALLEAVGATGNCIAACDADFQRIVNSLDL